MRYLDYYQKLELLKDIAQHKRMATPGQLAEKLGVSDRTVLRMISRLRQEGYSIRFDRNRLAYVLDN